MIFLEKIFQKLKNSGSVVSARNLPPKTYHLKPSHGFTLIEMLVVIAVIGILYLIVFGSVSDSKKRGRDSKRIADISVIQLALERYYDEFKKYPNDLSTLKSDTFYDDNKSLILKDPLDTDYLYGCTNSCQSYHLGTKLELDNTILTDDADLNSGGFNGAENTTNGFVYDVAPKF